MSVFTNPASGARDDGERYTRAVLELLGDRDPLDVLSTTVAWCRERTEGLGEDRLDRPEAPGKWSVGQVLQHLADSEVVWGWRLRTVLADDRPRLTGYDQDAWAARLGYAEADREEALAVFGALRASHLRLLGRASERDLDRVGLHEERGEESVRHMVKLYAGHDMVHRNQIDRILGGFP